MMINLFKRGDYSFQPRRGRPPVQHKKEFRNVAIPLETHPKIKALAEAEGRTIAKQLQFLIDQSYTQKFGSNSI